jgi:putative ABC transport system permease protein
MNLFRLLMRVLPRAFRQRYGRDMEEVFAVRMEVARRRGKAGIAALWWKETADLFVTSARLHLENLGIAGILADAAIGLRGLRRHPLFAATAIGTLALGIGSVTTMWAVVHAVLLNPLPYTDAERIVRIWPDYSPLRAEPSPRFALSNVTTRNVEFLSGEDYLSFARSAELEGVAAYTIYDSEIHGTGSEQPALFNAAGASANLFDLLGVPFQVGRGFLRAEGEAGVGSGGAAAVVVLSDRLWRTRFGASPTVVGETVYLAGTPSGAQGQLSPHQIVGVAPPELRYLEPQAEFWVPMDAGALAGGLVVIGRIRADRSMAAVRGSLGGLIRSWTPEQEQALADVPAADRVTLETLYESYSGFASRGIALPLGAAVLVLLLACANVANLLLSRLPARRQELAMRSALGAGGARLLAQLLTESAVLAALAAILGVAFARLGVVMVHAFGPQITPHLAQRFLDVELNGVVLLGCAGVAAGCILLFGALPAARGARTGALVGQPLVGSRSRKRGALIPVLLAGQMAVALVLLSSAGLLARSFSRLLSVELGFNPHGLLVRDIRLPGERYRSDPQRWSELLDGLVERLQQDDRVASAAVANFAGYMGGGLTDAPLRVEGEPQTEAPPDRREPRALNRVTPEFFATMGMRIVRGRGISPSDRQGSTVVAVINESLARRYWPGTDPIGKRIYPNPQRALEIVGVVADARDFRYHEPTPAYYVALAQFANATQVPLGGLYLRLVVRPSREPAAAESALREAVAALDPDIATGPGLPWDSEMERTALRDSRFQTLIFGTFGVIATVIAAAGVFGVLSYVVSQRTHEIGVRLALGGRPAQIGRLVVGQVGRLALAGISLGLVASLYSAKLLEGRLFELAPTDPVSYASSVLILIAMAVLGAWVPVRRATSIEPTETLKTH